MIKRRFIKKFNVTTKEKFQNQVQMKAKNFGRKYGTTKSNIMMLQNG